MGGTSFFARGKKEIYLNNQIITERGRLAVMNLERRAIGGWHRQEGAVAVEFALIITILTFLLGATIDFGHYFYLRHLALIASREGARYGAIYAEPKITAAQIRTFILERYGEALGGNNGVTVSVTGAGGSSGSDLRVTVTGTKEWFFLESVINRLAVAEALKHPSGSTVMKLE